MSKKTVVLDLEFCNVPKGTVDGLNSEIIEIGAVALDENNEIVNEFSTYVKPKYGYISKKLQTLTGISSSMLENKEEFEQCLDDFLEWIFDEDMNIDDFVGCASWSNNDLLQLEAEIVAKGLVSEKTNLMFSHWIDVQKDFGIGIGYTSAPLKLSVAVDAVDMKFSGKAHTALADAENTAILYGLLRDVATFQDKTKALRSLFLKDEASDTLGGMFGDFFSQLQLPSE